MLHYNLKLFRRMQQVAGYKLKPQLLTQVAFSVLQHPDYLGIATLRVVVGTTFCSLTIQNLSMFFSDKTEPLYIS